MFMPKERERIVAQVDDWAGEGLRLIGLAYRLKGVLADYSGYTWVGLLGDDRPHS